MLINGGYYPLMLLLLFGMVGKLKSIDKIIS